MLKSFSYIEYQKIIERLISRLPLLDFSDINTNTERFCIIRHDIEFSVDRALNLALFESEVLGIQSSYLFQLRNNCYNIISDVNIKKLHAIQSLGHTVGLHCHMNQLESLTDVKKAIRDEATVFSKLTGISVDRFSFHRPSQFLLKNHIQVDGLINCYDKAFFHYYETPHDNLDVKYLTDSRHEWHHGYPLDCQHNKIQLLTHPYSWSPEGANNLKNYKNILAEKSLELRQSINRETSTFPQSLLLDGS